MADSKYYIYATPISANNISSVSWSITENPYATINPKTGQLYVTKISSTKDDTSATATIKVNVIKSDGSVLKAEFNVGFYKRTTKVKDWVYADGTTSDVINLNKTLVGYCYYIDDSIRLCMSLTPIFGYLLTEFNITNQMDNNFSSELNINSLITTCNTDKIPNIQRGQLVPAGLINTYGVSLFLIQILNDKYKPFTKDNFEYYKSINSLIGQVRCYEPKTKPNEHLYEKFTFGNWFMSTRQTIDELLKLNDDSFYVKWKPLTKYYVTTSYRNSIMTFDVGGMYVDKNNNWTTEITNGNQHCILSCVF